jgi:hypothetical protein
VFLQLFLAMGGDLMVRDGLRDQNSGVEYLIYYCTNDEKLQ